MTRWTRLTRLALITTTVCLLAALPSAARADDATPPDCAPSAYVIAAKKSVQADGQASQSFRWDASCAADAERATWQAVRVIDHTRPYLTDPTNRVAATDEQDTTNAAPGEAAWTPQADAAGIHAVVVRLYDADDQQLTMAGTAFVVERPPTDDSQIDGQTTCPDGSTPASNGCRVIAPPARLSMALRPSVRVVRRGQTVTLRVVVRSNVRARSCVRVPRFARIVRAGGARITSKRRAACWRANGVQRRTLRVKINARSTARVLRAQARSAAPKLTRTATATIRIRRR